MTATESLVFRTINDFCNKIGTKRTYRGKRAHVRFRREADMPRRRACGKTLGVKEAERCHFSGSGDQSGRRLRGLQIACGLLAPLGHDVVADLLAFHEGAHAGALDRADVHEHVPAAVARLDESKAFLSIEELHGT